MRMRASVSIVWIVLALSIPLDARAETSSPDPAASALHVALEAQARLPADPPRLLTPETAIKPPAKASAKTASSRAATVRINAVVERRAEHLVQLELKNVERQREAAQARGQAESGAVAGEHGASGQARSSVARDRSGRSTGGHGRALDAQGGAASPSRGDGQAAASGPGQR
jgi:hypothetical protein